MNPDTEAARVAWASAVETSNATADLMERAIETGDNDFLIETLATKLEQARETVDLAYKAYLVTMENWIAEAPRRYDVVVLPSVFQSEAGRRIPGLTFAFRGGVEAPVTVALLNVESDLRKFQKELDKAITTAIRESRKEAS